MRPRRATQDVTGDIASEIAAWRERVLDTLLLVTLGASTVIIVLVFFDTSRNTGQWGIAAAFALLYLVVVALTVLRRLPIRIRAWGLLLLIYLAGTLAFVRGGLAGDGRLYFLALPALAFIVLGPRAAAITGGMTIISFILLAAAFSEGWLPELRVAGVPATWAWLLAGTVWLGVTSVLVAMQWLLSQFQEEALVSRARLYQETDRLRAFNENIVQSMQEGVLVEDATGRIEFVNPRAVELTGYPASEIVGRRWEEMVAPDQIEHVRHRARSRRRIYLVGVLGVGEELDLHADPLTRVCLIESGHHRAHRLVLALTALVTPDFNHGFTRLRRAARLLFFAAAARKGQDHDARQKNRNGEEDECNTQTIEHRRAPP